MYVCMCTCTNTCANLNKGILNLMAAGIQVLQVEFSAFELNYSFFVCG